MSGLRLTKLHATGNDFLVVSDLDDRWASLPSTDRALLCDRRFGVGADGLIRILAGSDGAQLGMELSNADGAFAEMSGNGIRCLAAVAVRDGLVPSLSFTVATGSGVRRVDYAETPEVASARVDMGPATFEPAEIPVSVPSPFELEASLDGVTYSGDAAGMGNPHLVLFVDDPQAAPVAAHGPRLEHDPRFPNRTNVEFVAVHDASIHMRVWERGVGETLSCGTGACAAAAVANRRGLVSATTEVCVPGGRLRVELAETIWLGGPVVPVFEAEVDLDRLRQGVPEGALGVVEDAP